MTKKIPHSVEPFGQVLARNQLSLVRADTTILQLNTGLFCNLSCRHCHLEAGPTRKEVMDSQVVSQVIEFAGRFQFEAIDVTGGAPESMSPSTRPLPRKGGTCANAKPDGVMWATVISSTVPSAPISSSAT